MQIYCYQEEFAIVEATYSPSRNHHRQIVISSSFHPFSTAFPIPSHSLARSPLVHFVAFPFFDIILFPFFFPEFHTQFFEFGASEKWGGGAENSRVC